MGINITFKLLDKICIYQKTFTMKLCRTFINFKTFINFSDGSIQHVIETQKTG